MLEANQGEVTRLLAEWQGGDRSALDRLMPLVYDELRVIAGRLVRRHEPSPTVQSTAVVHEAYLKLIGQNRTNWQGRAHFFGVAATLIRNILVDHARRRGAEKRGGVAPLLSLDEALVVAGRRDIELVALDDALVSLAKIDPQQARIVELRFFGGLSIEETAEVAGISPATVKRDWVMAKAWIFRALSA